VSPRRDPPPLERKGDRHLALDFTVARWGPEAWARLAKPPLPERPQERLLDPRTGLPIPVRED